MRRFSSNGSPTCTLGRLAASSSSSPKPAEASTDTPPMPSRPGGRAEQHGEVADARRLAEHQPLGGQHAEAEHVDERVVRVGLVEDDLAADGRHADRVAVAGDAGHDALGDPAAAGVVERPEPQRVHQGDGAGAHREDVAEDAADAGGRALVGLDGRRVVVALDADGGGDAVADVDHAGVLARADEHARPFGGQPAQVDAAATCTSSARTTSPRTWPARGGSARGRGCARWPPPRRRSARGRGGSARRRARPEVRARRASAHGTRRSAPPTVQMSADGRM